MTDKLAPEIFRRELQKMVESPAWAELAGWWTEHLVRRVLSAPAGSQSSEQGQADLAGGRALLLAIENEVTRSQQEAMHDNRSRINRAAVKAANKRQSGGAGRAERARGTGKQADPKEAGS
jgi:hypothetical protein